MMEYIYCKEKFKISPLVSIPVNNLVAVDETALMLFVGFWVFLKFLLLFVFVSRE